MSFEDGCHESCDGFEARRMQPNALGTIRFGRALHSAKRGLSLEVMGNHDP